MKIKLFTHTDLDGIGCVVLAYLAFGKENVDVEYCNYDDVDDKVEAFLENEDLYRSYDSIFITDISVSDQVASMIDCLDKTERTVRLFDHHGTALRLDNYFWCTVYEYLDAVKTSGTELFYLYLRNTLSGSYSSHAMKNNIKRFATIVRNYDTWRWKELGEDGLVSKQMNDLFYIYGQEKFIDWAMDNIYNLYLLSPMHTFPYFSETDTLLLEQKQNEIDIYIEQKEKQITVKTDQWGNTYGVIFAERYFSELGNRLCEIHPELAYIAMIDISRGRVSYRTIRDDINLGTEIAHNYGGGGHPKAAGSTFDISWAMDIVSDWLFGMQDSDSEAYEANVDTFENPVRIAPDEFVKKYTAKLPSADPWLSNAGGSL